MIKTVISYLWSLLKLPVTLVRLPFKIFSAALTAIMYITFAAVFAIGIYVFVL